MSSSDFEWCSEEDTGENECKARTKGIPPGIGMSRVGRCLKGLMRGW